MYKIQVVRVKLSNPISKFKFINTNQMSIHLFPVMHLYALQTLYFIFPVHVRNKKFTVGQKKIFSAQAKHQEIIATRCVTQKSTLLSYPAAEAWDNTSRIQSPGELCSVDW